MSVCSTSQADMLYVNRIYVCIVNIKLEITYGLCIPTYLQCPFPSYLCYSAYPSAQLGYAVRCCHGSCACWLAQRACEREWEFLIPTSGRTTPTWGGVASPGSIPARRRIQSRSRWQVSARASVYILSDIVMWFYIYLCTVWLKFILCFFYLSS